jgi:WhiB family redox-sensing transcriptional regulator
MNRLGSVVAEAPTSRRSVEATKRWYQMASCLGHDPYMWYPAEVGVGAEAIAICAECPVQLDCLGWALEHNERVGIWGGVSARRRLQMGDEARLRGHSVPVPPRVQPLPRSKMLRSFSP